jgi:hypothetical protein
MSRHISLIVVVALCIAGCGKGAKNDVLSETKTTVVYATTQCTVPNADGVRCDKKTCKADAQSDCKVFNDRCTQSGHQNDGDDSASTCTRGDGIG